MDRNKYTTIAHSGMRYCSPFSSEKIEDIINLLDLTPEAHVLYLRWGRDTPGFGLYLFQKSFS